MSHGQDSPEQAERVGAPDGSNETARIPLAGLGEDAVSDTEPSRRPHFGAILVKNSVILVGVEVLAKVLGLLVFVWMARMVGSADLGIYGFAISVSNVAALLPRFGFERYVQREVPRAPESFSQVWSNIMAIKVLLCIVAFSALLGGLYVTGASVQKIWIVSLVAVYVLVLDFLSFNASCFRAFQKAQYEAYARIFFSMIYVGLGFYVLDHDGGVTGIATVLIIAGLAAVLYSIWLLHRRIHRISFSFEISSMRDALRKSFSFFLLMLVILLYNQIDILTLSFLATDHETGIYVAALKIFETTSLIPAGITGAILPALCRDWHIDKERFGRTFTASFGYLIMLALPLAAGGSICSKGLMGLLYGSQYDASSAVFAVLIWTTVFGFINHLSFAGMVAMDREMSLLWVCVGAVVVGLVINVILIPYFGAIGCAVGAIAIQLFLSIVTLIPIVRRLRRAVPMFISLLKAAGCAGVMSAVLLVFQVPSLVPQVPPVLLQIPIGAVVYLAALILSGAVSVGDFRMLIRSRG